MSASLELESRPRVLPLQGLEVLPTEEQLRSHTLEYLYVTPEEAEVTQRILDDMVQEEPIKNFLAVMRENNDSFTANHSYRVAAASTVLGMRMGVDAEDLSILAAGAMSHDVGKEDREIQEVVHSNVRYEPGDPRRDTMMKTIRLHPGLSAQRVHDTQWSDEKRRKVENIVGAHHYFPKNEAERYGIPPDNDVRQLAEIVAAADMLDALASERPYKQAFSRAKTMQILRDQFGGDPHILEAGFARTINLAEGVGAYAIV